MCVMCVAGEQAGGENTEDKFSVGETGETRAGRGLRGEGVDFTSLCIVSVCAVCVCRCQ